MKRLFLCALAAALALTGCGASAGTAASAVSTIWAAIRHVLLAPETHMTVSAFSGTNKDTRTIRKHLTCTSFLFMINEGFHYKTFDRCINQKRFAAPFII